MRKRLIWGSILGLAFGAIGSKGGGDSDALLGAVLGAVTGYWLGSAFASQSQLSRTVRAVATCTLAGCVIGFVGSGINGIMVGGLVGLTIGTFIALADKWDRNFRSTTK
jgi:hypothetical protein